MSNQPPSLPEEKAKRNTFEIIEDTQEMRPVMGDYPPGYYPSAPKRGVYLSVWSLLVTFLLVIMLAGGIIGAVIALGGRYQASSRPPVLITVAAPMSATAPPPADLLNAESVASQPLPLFTQVPAQSVQLSGPTMVPTITPTPTPPQIVIGATVFVVSQQGANVRAAAGTDGQLRFMAHNNQRLTVIGGPQEANGLTWWQVQNPLDHTFNGWIAQTDGQQDLISVYIP